MTYLEFKQMVLGNGYDIDKYYGAQCWDGAAEYWSVLGYPIIHCSQSGYAKDIWNLRKTNGILNNHKEVTVMKPGDIAVFKEVANWTPYSHIAIFDSDIDGQYGWFLGQNQGGTPYTTGGACFNLCRLPYYATFDTAFRPNALLGASGSGNGTTTVTGKPDQILEVGSVVSSVPMKIGNQGLTSINGDVCCYLSQLGGWFPIKYLSEYDASDGAKDNYLANTKARVYVDQTTVQAVNAGANLVQIYGIWVNPTPLLEVRNG